MRQPSTRTLRAVRQALGLHQATGRPLAGPGHGHLRIPNPESLPAHERALRDYARTRLSGLNWLNVQGNSAGKGAIFSFTLQGPAHAHDISTVPASRCVRAPIARCR